MPSQEGSGGTAEVAASTQVAAVAAFVLVVVTAPFARAAADFPVWDMLAFPAADLQEAGRHERLLKSFHIARICQSEFYSIRWCPKL